MIRLLRALHRFLGHLLERLRAYQLERGFRNLNEALGGLLGGVPTEPRTS